MASIVRNKVFEVADLPPGRRTVKSRWVFGLKQPTDKTLQYKARMVAKGFTQVQGVDYDEVFAPVTRVETLRFLLGIVAARDLELEQIGVKTAFLNGSLDEELYMEPPELPPRLQETYGSKRWARKVWRLLRALYGLKQASKAWYRALRKVLIAHGFEEATSDPCLFFIPDDTGDKVYLLVYVDDALIAGKDKKFCQKVKDMFAL